MEERTNVTAPMVLDLDKLASLLHRAEEDWLRVDGKDIVLLLGKTGAGKTTTAAFLLGHKFTYESLEVTERLDDGTEIQCQQDCLIAREALPEGLVIGSEMSSVTQSLNMFPVDDGFFIVDTPGFGDTNGVEVDIANCVSISNVLRRARTVRPIVVLSTSTFLNSGDGRGESFRQFLGLLSNLFSRFEDSSRKITFLITHGKGKTKNECTSSLVAHQKSPSIEGDSKTIVTHLIKAWSGEMGRVWFLHPDEQDHDALWDPLKAVEGMSANEFNFAMTLPSKEAFSTAMKEIQLLSDMWLDEGKFSELAKILASLDDLGPFFKDVAFEIEIREARNSAVEKLQKMVRQRMEKSLEDFHLQLFKLAEADEAKLQEIHGFRLMLLSMEEAGLSHVLPLSCEELDSKLETEIKDLGSRVLPLTAANVYEIATAVGKLAVLDEWAIDVVKRPLMGRSFVRAKEITRESIGTHCETVSQACKKISALSATEEDLDNITTAHSILKIACGMCEIVGFEPADVGLASCRIFLSSIRQVADACQSGLQQRNIDGITRSYELLRLVLSHPVNDLVKAEHNLESVLDEEIHNEIVAICADILNRLSSDGLGVSKKKDPILFVHFLRSLSLKIQKNIGEKFDGVVRSVWSQVQKHVEKIKEACGQPILDLQPLRKSLPKLQKSVWLDPLLNNVVSAKYAKTMTRLHDYSRELKDVVLQTWDSDPQTCCDKLQSLELLCPLMGVEGANDFFLKTRETLCGLLTKECSQMDLEQTRPDILACENAVEKLERWMDLAKKVGCAVVLEKKRDELISYCRDTYSKLTNRLSTTDLSNLSDPQVLEGALQQLNMLKTTQNKEVYQSIFQDLTNKFGALEAQIYFSLENSDVGRAGELISVFSRTMVLLNNDEVRTKYTHLRSALNASRKDSISRLRQDFMECKYEPVKEALLMIKSGNDPLLQQAVTIIHTGANAKLKTIAEAKSKAIGEWSYSSVNSLKNLILDFEEMYSQLFSLKEVKSSDFASRRQGMSTAVDLALTTHVKNILRMIDGLIVFKLLSSTPLLRYLHEFPKIYVKTALEAERGAQKKLERFPELVREHVKRLMEVQNLQEAGNLLRDFHKAERELNDHFILQKASTEVVTLVQQFLDKKCGIENQREAVEDLEEMVVTFFPAQTNLLSPIKKAKLRIQKSEQNLTAAMYGYFESHNWKKLAETLANANASTRQQIMTKLREKTKNMIDGMTSQLALSHSQNAYALVCHNYEEIQGIVKFFPEIGAFAKSPLEHVHHLCESALSAIQENLDVHLHQRKMTHQIIKELYLADSLCSVLRGTPKKHVEEMWEMATRFLRGLVATLKDGLTQVNCEKLTEAMESLNEFCTLGTLKKKTPTSQHMKEFISLLHTITEENYPSQIEKIFASSLADMIADWDASKDFKIAARRYAMSQHTHYNEIRARYLQNKGPPKEEFVRVIKEKVQEQKRIALDSYPKALAPLDKSLKHLNAAGNAGFEDAAKALKEIINTIENQIKQLVENSINFSKDVHVIFLDLVTLKEISEGAPELTRVVDHYLRRMVSAHAKHLGPSILELGLKLHEHGGVGKELVNIYPEFKCFVQKEFRKKTAKHGLDYCLQGLKCYSKPSVWMTLKSLVTGTNADKLQFLKPAYETYNQEWKSWINKYAATNDKQMILNQLKSASNSRKSLREKVPSMVALIFAWISIQESDPEMVKQDPETRWEPHVMQVLTVLLLLGVEKNELAGQVMQIATGEGKSIILAVVATVLALCGYQISCVCYSEILKQRDWLKFQELFRSLDVLAFISYDTIDELCNRLLTEDGDPRAMTDAFVSGESISSPPSRSIREKILLIDEIDVFFGDDFYGRTFNPLSDVSGSFEVLEEAWEYFTVHKNLTEECIQSFPSWKKLMEKYNRSFKPFFDAQLQMMVRDIQIFKNRKYKINNNLIGYQSQDSYNYGRVHGLETAFCYFWEHSKGNISADSLKENARFFFPCGNYSYAEIPKKFKHVLGVTGTLDALSNKEKGIIQKYGIEHIGYAPSVYGSSMLQFKEREHITVLMNEANFFLTITQRIQTNVYKKKPVLVFFSNSEILDKYIADQNPKSYFGEKFQTIVEGCDNQDLRIKKAVMSGQVTLLTKNFGRGTDFVCFDNAVKDAGGAHVIQTFFASTFADEVQIKGRTARQGDPGTYELILSYPSLKKKYGVDQDEVGSNADVYALLKTERDEKHERKVKEREERVKDAKKLHDRSMTYLKAIAAGKRKEARNIFLDF